VELQSQKSVLHPYQDVLASLRLKVFDWPLPLAVFLTSVISVVGRPSSPDGTYRIGSPTFFANVFGPWVVFLLVLYVGIRWINRHAYSDRLLVSDWSKRAMLRRLIDIPGTAVIGMCAFFVALLVLGGFDE
jgi:hypothetical protein